MTIIDKANKTVEINIEGIIGGGFWDEENEDAIQTKEQMRAELKAIGNAKADHIIVNINSYGGDVNHGISIHDMLAQHSAKVTTRVNGFTASIAATISQAGDDREISSNSLFLIHKPSLVMIGGFNENDLEKRKKSLQIVDKKIRDIFTKRGVDSAKVDELMEEENGTGRWMDADEAVEFSFIDSIYEPMKMAACVNSPEVLNQMGISLIPENKMAQDTSKIKEMFDGLKNWMIENNIIKPPPAEGEEGEEGTGGEAQATIIVAPEEITNKLTAFQESLDAIELNNEAEASVEALTAEKVTFEKTISDLKAENKTQKERVIELEGKLTKLNGQSTQIEGVEGMEDPANEGITPEQKALKSDLHSLRNQFTETHA